MHLSDPLVRWVLPLVSTSAWATLSYLTMEHLCWFGYNHKMVYWVSEGPRLLIIILNFLFLVNILRMLYTKVRPLCDHHSDTSRWVDGEGRWPLPASSKTPPNDPSAD